MPMIRRCRKQGCINNTTDGHYYCEQHRALEAEYLEDKQRHRTKQGAKAYSNMYDHHQRLRSDDKINQRNFYNSRKWKLLRTQVLIRDGYLCGYCKVQDVITPNCNTVDHIVPIEADSVLKDNSNNLITTCRSCHKIKTAWEQNYYGTGQGKEVNDNNKINSIDLIVRLMNAK